MDPVAASLPPDRTVRKVVVAVHGIGDQAQNETALATTIRFCDYFGYPGMVSLGAFYGSLQGPRARWYFGPDRPPAPALVLPEPSVPSQFRERIGFAEVYWADIPRRLEREGYTLQETKAWALTVVNRVRVLAAQRDAANTSIDYPRIRQVLEEMIQAIAVLESLLFLSRKAGVFDFDLSRILNAFLGDVQIVTDFAPVRAQIVAVFHEVLGAIGRLYPEAEIHVVAHSEGTVVSWLGLLEAASNPARHAWIRQVRGYMTLGSPIDKHLILWPALFERFKGANYQPAPADRIRWINYVDYGDPVGFNLDTARDWMKARGYDAAFSFDENEDFSFRRYPFPGKAHVDYWADPEVFGHFIRTVVDPAPAASPEEAEFLKNGPASRAWVPFVSYGVGYLLPLALVHVGVYVLCKAVGDYLDPDATQEHPHLIACVLGLSWLVAGTTVWLRLVRLTRTWRWFWLGAFLYSAGAAAFWALTRRAGDSAGAGELQWFDPVAGSATGWIGQNTLLASAALVALVLLFNARFWRRRKS